MERLWLIYLEIQIIFRSPCGLPARYVDSFSVKEMLELQAVNLSDNTLPFPRVSKEVS